MVHLNNVTWGELIRRLRKFGVTEETVEVSGEGVEPRLSRYLSRDDGRGNALTFPLPIHSTQQDKVGAWVVESVCKRLRVDMNKLELPAVL